MSDDTFAKFEEEFGAISNALARKINSIPLQDDKESQLNLIQEAEQEVADGTTCINNIEMEIRHYPYHLKAKAQAKLRELTKKFDDQKTELSQLKPGATSKKTFSSQQEREAYRDQRNRLLGAKKAVDNTSISLDNTIRSIEETQTTGALTSAQLIQQRETLIHSRETIRETDDVLQRSRKLLIRMRRRIVTNKLIVGVIILVELGIIALIVYLKWYR